ncbi:hypothetical protein [Roseateles sp.]|uniref:hypothetical protein n=1 Tax=Roseateles sp. TaxID=1971397 RepID=UPI00286D5B53|nr:hypothetical protein [Roseateles sp.]
MIEQQAGKFDSYGGQSFVVRAQQEGNVWTGHFRVLAPSTDQARAAPAPTHHRWTPLDPGWATENEARTNATEAAHAAIDALLSGRIP